MMSTHLSHQVSFDPDFTGGLRVAVVVAQFNANITSSLLEAANSAFVDAGVPRTAITVVPVPGAFELPLVAMRYADTGKYDGVLTLGCVIKGDTDHYEHICRAATDGVSAAALQTGVPIAFGVLTAQNEQQAFDRSGGALGNLGTEYAHALLQTCHALKDVE